MSRLLRFKMKTRSIKVTANKIDTFFVEVFDQNLAGWLRLPESVDGTEAELLALGLSVVADAPPLPVDPPKEKPLEVVIATFEDGVPIDNDASSDAVVKP